MSWLEQPGFFCYNLRDRGQVTVRVGHIAQKATHLVHLFVTHHVREGCVCWPYWQAQRGWDPQTTPAALPVGFQLRYALSFLSLWFPLCTDWKFLVEASG